MLKNEIGKTYNILGIDSKVTGCDKDFVAFVRNDGSKYTATYEALKKFEQLKGVFEVE